MVADHIPLRKFSSGLDGKRVMSMNREAYRGMVINTVSPVYPLAHSSYLSSPFFMYYYVFLNGILLGLDGLTVIMSTKGNNIVPLHFFVPSIVLDILRPFYVSKENLKAVQIQI